jgi:hypothetical protein
VVLLGPESYCQGSGSFVLRGGGGSRKLAVAVLGAHTPSKNPRPVSRAQAYTAYLLSRSALRFSQGWRSQKFLIQLCALAHLLL